MRVVGAMSPEDQAAYDAAVKVYAEAVKARDALPKEEGGTLDFGALEADEKLSPFEHRAWIGRSERFIAAQDAVTETSNAMRRADKSYFRLNIGGMGVYREAMTTLGMVFWDYSMPTWPEAPEQLDDREYDEVYGLEDALLSGESSFAPVKPHVLAYAEQRVAHLAWRPADQHGIPGHKLGSNDGWHVTPQDITEALEAYRRHDGDRVRSLLKRAGVAGEDGDISYWLEWIGFLEYAREHGGFRTH